ncbi:MAG: hypothetical protein AUJ75_03600 [Candidatus Omnitrophica bacterium CG1_02_49_10]|nr:MAG: hypothetical protein AUJ75_03600 [Candidatus Omnitrophica bacterium CG1_02_49_10]
MSEEMNEEKNKDVKEEKLDEVPAEVKSPEAAAPEKKELPRRKPADIPKNCTSCNKPMKSTMLYYREGSYYCGKRCWKKAKAKTAEGKDAAKE